MHTEANKTASSKRSSALERRILYMATDAHGGFGGISQFNRDTIEALSNLKNVERINVLPRLADAPLPVLPQKIAYNLNGIGGRFNYMVAAVQATLSSRPTLIVCGHVNLLPAALVAKRLTGAPILLMIHGIDAWSAPRSSAYFKIGRDVDLVLAVSNCTRNRFLSWCSIPVEKVRVFPNTVRIEFFGEGPRNGPAAQRFGVDGRKILMTLGRMSASERYKGFDEVIESLAVISESVPDVLYIAAGDGDDRARLEAKARDLGVAEKVAFTGLVTEREKVELLRSADLFVLLSSGEGFGIVLLEALACGTPVVGSTIDGTRDALLDGALGRLVDPTDPEAVQGAIVAGLQDLRGVPELLKHYSFEAFSRRLEGELRYLNQVVVR